MTVLRMIEILYGIVDCCAGPTNPQYQSIMHSYCTAFTEQRRPRRKLNRGVPESIWDASLAPAKSTQKGVVLFTSPK